MTTYTVKFWGKTVGNTDISRLYINAADRSALGYIERKIVSAERQYGSAYDNHRMAKGDTLQVISDDVSFHLAADLIAEILADGTAEFGPLPENHDDLSVFFRVQEMTAETRAARKAQAARSAKNGVAVQKATAKVEAVAGTFQIGQSIKTKRGQVGTLTSIDGHIAHVQINGSLVKYHVGMISAA